LHILFENATSIKVPSNIDPSFQPNTFPQPQILKKNHLNALLEADTTSVDIDLKAIFFET
jgi:hypothetical protein